VRTEWDDPEFKAWNKEAQYIFQERLGILCGDTPFSQCDPEAIEIARKQARGYNSVKQIVSV
jgi:hypothetical protein